MVDPGPLRFAWFGWFSEMEHRCSKVKSKKDIANFSAKDADRPPQALGFLDLKQLKRSLQWRIWRMWQCGSSLVPVSPSFDRKLLLFGMWLVLLGRSHTRTAAQLCRGGMLAAKPWSSSHAAVGSDGQDDKSGWDKDFATSDWWLGPLGHSPVNFWGPPFPT